MFSPFDVLPIGTRVVVTRPVFPPMSNRGKIGYVVAVFDFPITQLHYHVEIEGVVYDYDPAEIVPVSAFARRAA